MILRNIAEAKAQLSALIEAVRKGEEVVIGKAGTPVAKLVRFSGPKKPRTPGALKGKVKIGRDFDELPADLEEAFGVK